MLIQFPLSVSSHSHPQSLRSFWPAAGIESSGSNHYERTKEITEFWLSGSLRICFYGACLKWLLPELSIPAAGQKDRRLWGRDWCPLGLTAKQNFYISKRVYCSNQIYSPLRRELHTLNIISFGAKFTSSSSSFRKYFSLIFEFNRKLLNLLSITVIDLNEQLHLLSTNIRVFSSSGKQ